MEPSAFLNGGAAAQPRSIPLSSSCSNRSVPAWIPCCYRTAGSGMAPGTPAALGTTGALLAVKATFLLTLLLARPYVHRGVMAVVAACGALEVAAVACMLGIQHAADRAAVQVGFMVHECATTKVHDTQMLFVSLIKVVYHAVPACSHLPGPLPQVKSNYRTMLCCNAVLCCVLCPAQGAVFWLEVSVAAVSLLATWAALAPVTLVLARDCLGCLRGRRKPR